MVRRSFGIAVVLLLGCVDVSLAQNECAFGVCINNNRPDDSVVTSGLRSPGRMVTEGVARTIQNTNQAQRPIEITEPLEPDVLDEFIPDAIDTIVNDLTEMLLYLGNLLLERAGLPGIDIPIGNDNSNTNDNTGRPDKPGTR